MPKKSGIVLVIMGAVLILSALLLFLSNEAEDRRAGQEAELLMDDIRSAIAEKPATPEKPSETSTAITSEPDEIQIITPQMPVVTIDGYDYIGYISIPDLELELPVMAEWDYHRLEIAPCRHFGSIETDDLVIAAHNYMSHFGSLSTLQPGAEVVFTNMDGIENHYTLTKEPVALAPNDVDAVQNSGYDLVLYTCTPGGMSRFAAFCDRAEE